MTATELAGTWVFNDTIDFPDSATSWDVNFISNDIVYNRLEINASKGGKIIYVNNSSLYAYENVWQDDVYKTITITSKLSEVTNGDALLTWLQSNATKQ